MQRPNIRKLFAVIDQSLKSAKVNISAFKGATKKHAIIENLTNASLLSVFIT